MLSAFFYIYRNKQLALNRNKKNDISTVNKMQKKINDFFSRFKICARNSAIKII